MFEVIVGEKSEHSVLPKFSRLRSSSLGAHYGNLFALHVAPKPQPEKPSDIRGGEAVCGDNQIALRKECDGEDDGVPSARHVFKFLLAKNRLALRRNRSPPD
jgi:hypothetical protein